MRLFFQLSSIHALQLFQLLRFATTFITGILLARSGLSPESISQYETFLLVTYAASFFWLSGLVNTLLTTYPNSAQPSVLLFHTAVLLLITSMFSAAVIIILEQLHIIHIQQTMLLILYMMLAIPTYLNEYIFLLHEKNKLLSAYGIASFVIHILLVGLIVTFCQQIIMVLWVLVLIAALKIVMLIFLIRRYATCQLQTSTIKSILSLATPLSISYLLSGSAEVIDGIIVKTFFSEHDFAIYRYGARELPVVLLLANAFSSATLPKIAANLPEGLQLIKRNSLHLYNIFFPVTLALLFFSKKIYNWLFTETFSAGAEIFNIYLLLIISRLLFPQTIINGLKAHRILMVSSFFEVVINIGVSLLLMKPFGLAGIAAGTVIAHLTDKLILIAYCKFALKISPEQYISIFQHVFFSILLLLSAYWIYVFL